MPTLQEKTLAAIRAGKATSTESLAKAIGTDNKSASTALGGLVRRGLVVAEKVHARAYDWSTVRIVGEGTAKRSATKASLATAPKRAVKPRAPKTEPTEPSRLQLVDALGLVRVGVLARQLAEELEALTASARDVPNAALVLAEDPALVDAFARFAEAIRRPITMASPAAAERRARRETVAAIVASSTHAEPAIAEPPVVDDDEPARGDEPVVASEETSEESAEGSEETDDEPDATPRDDWGYESEDDEAELAADPRPILADDTEPTRGSGEGDPNAARAFQVTRTPGVAYTLVHVDTGREVQTFREEWSQRDGQRFDKALVRAMQRRREVPGTAVVITKTGTELAPAIGG